MKITILTLFPEMFEALNHSILSRAQKNKLLEIEIVNIRDFSLDNNKRCDDYSYGGGAGMIMTPQPLFDAIKSVKTSNAHTVYMSPKGKVLSQQKVEELAKLNEMIIVCGHYEGIDQRIIDLCIDEEISIGDYVLTGGEVPAMVLVDSVARLIPGVINERSHLGDSFSESYLLDYPTYTKPRVFEGMEVPEVLVSGDHKRIAEYRLEESIKKTKLRRPDLLEK